VGEERVVHVLEEEGRVVEGVEGDAVGSVRGVSNEFVRELAYGGLVLKGTYSFTRSNCSFLGRISSM
jgi:hypothetical protein